MASQEVRSRSIQSQRRVASLRSQRHVHLQGLQRAHGALRPGRLLLGSERELFAGKRRIGEMLVELKHVFCCSEWTRVEDTHEKFTDMFTKSAESRDAISEGSSSEEDSPYLSWEGVRRRSSPRRHFVKVRESFK